MPITPGFWPFVAMSILLLGFASASFQLVNAVVPQQSRGMVASGTGNRNAGRVRAPTAVVAIIGPSASGKSSVVRALEQQGVIRIHPTWTTRPRRPDEVDGSAEHRFVTDAAFDDLQRTGFFLDTISMFGLPHRYGLRPFPAPSSGRVDVLLLRAPLVQRLRDHAHVIAVYQIEDDEDRARARLLERGTPPDELAARLRDNRTEILAGRAIADRVFVNDDTLDDLVRRVAASLRDDLDRPAPSALGATHHD